MATGTQIMALRFIQLELPLFGTPTFESLISKAGIRGLSVEFNDRIRSSWKVVRRPLSRSRILYVPRMFENAPEPVKTALIGWALMPWKSRRRKNSGHSAVKKDYERTIWQYFRDNGIEAGRGRAIDPKRFSGNTAGAVYDLAEVCSHVNRTYFENKISTFIKWGSAYSRTSFQTFRRDSDNIRHSIITISGIYNHPDVPRYAIESVVFHEMLHVKIPSFRSNGRNIMHGAEFKKEEKSFPLYNQWRKWEKTELPVILRDMIRSRRKGKSLFGYHI
jgi:hypothetical protein